MKYLSHYIQDQQTEIFNKYGAFFAFSTKQFNEQKQDKIKYTRLSSGLICPSVWADRVHKELNKCYHVGIKQDIAENGIKNIIHRELANYECQISMDISDCVNALCEYPVTEEMIQKEWKEYWDNCVKNDWF